MAIQKTNLDEKGELEMEETTGGSGPGPTKEPVTTFHWICGDMQCKTIDCFRSPYSNQCVANLWEATEPTDFHDANLAKATKQINAILSEIEKRNRNPKRKLSIIQVENRHLLVWAAYGALGPDDKAKAVIKALRLKVPKRERKKRR